MEKSLEQKLKEVEDMLDYGPKHDYYSITWPVASRAWEFGTYIKEEIKHHIPYW